VKIKCAWCGDIVGYRCNQCWMPLTAKKNEVTGELYLVCNESKSPIEYHDTTLMQVVYCICDLCLPQDRIAPVKPGRSGLSIEDMANIAAQSFKKRGPKGGVVRATTRAAEENP